jgi:hypothetical protein
MTYRRGKEFHRLRDIASHGWSSARFIPPRRPAAPSMVQIRSVEAGEVRLWMTFDESDDPTQLRQLATWLLELAGAIEEAPRP